MHVRVSAYTAVWIYVTFHCLQVCPKVPLQFAAFSLGAKHKMWGLEHRAVWGDTYRGVTSLLTHVLVPANANLLEHKIVPFTGLYSHIVCWSWSLPPQKQHLWSHRLCQASAEPVSQTITSVTRAKDAKDKVIATIKVSTCFCSTLSQKTRCPLKYTAHVDTCFLVSISLFKLKIKCDFFAFMGKMNGLQKQDMAQHTLYVAMLKKRALGTNIYSRHYFHIKSYTCCQYRDIHTHVTHTGFTGVPLSVFCLHPYSTWCIMIDK